MSTKTFEDKLGYHFKDNLLLEKALTHASKSPNHLERQEFLGDAVLGLVIADYLYDHFPGSAEGDLSKMRASLVCKDALLYIANRWAIAVFLQVGDGERGKNHALKSQSIAANAVEAVLGAVFEDTGFDAVQTLILREWQPLLQDVQPVNLRDAKSQLQELTQAQALGLPNYVLHDLGVTVSPRFQAICFLNKQKLGEGLGNRKKEAELEAAKQALTSKIIQKIKG
ncbi:MAG TPA: ribonuclease III [Ghiorsea sp.]|nr:ribonuclease III [Ghiorsea sp.]